MQQEDVSIIRRPDKLSDDSTPSIPVFQHIIDNFPCDIHLNYNCNFPKCPQSVFDKAIEVCKEHGESLSDPMPFGLNQPIVLNLMVTSGYYGGDI